MPGPVTRTQPSGSTAVTTTIQAAHDAASAGAVIWIPNGTYNEAVTVTKTITFVGQSSAAIVNGAGTRTRWFDVRATGVTIENLTMQNSAAEQWWGGIVTGYNGVYVNTLTVRNCEMVFGGHSAIATKLGNGHIIEDNIVRECGVVGIRIDSGEDHIVRRNYVYDNAILANRPAWYSKGTESGGIKLAGNYASGGAAATHNGTGYLNGVIVENNRFYDNKGPGVWFDVSSGSSAKHNIVRNNRVWGNDAQGIVYELSYYGEIYDNQIWNNGYSYAQASDVFGWGAAVLIQNSSNCTVSNNTLAWNRDGIILISQLRGAPWENPTSNVVQTNTVAWTQSEVTSPIYYAGGFFEDYTGTFNAETHNNYYQNNLYHALTPTTPNAEPAGQFDPPHRWKIKDTWFGPNRVFDWNDYVVANTGEAYITTATKDSTLTSNYMPLTPGATWAEPPSSGYSVQFTPSDTRSTSVNELTWRVRTAASNGGTLLLSGTATSGATVTTGTISDPGLADGTNQRFLLVTDGAGNILDQSFNVQANLTNPVPVLTSINPATKAATSAGFTLTVTGSAFVTTSVVRWNGAALPTTYISTTTLTATVATALIATEGTALVTVFNPTPVGGLSAAQTFTIGPPPPRSSIPVASGRRAQPRFYLAIYPPLGSANSRNRLDTLDINPSRTATSVASTYPGGWSELSVGIEREGESLTETHLPSDVTFPDFAHVEMTDGAFTLFAGRVVMLQRPGGHVQAFRATGYGYTALGDNYYESASIVATTSGDVLKRVLASAAPVVRPATGTDYVDPQVSHAPNEFTRLFPSQILDQITKEGDSDGNLMDWAVWEEQRLHLKARLAPARPDYWLPFDPVIVTAWDEDASNLRGAVLVEYTVNGVTATTAEITTPGFVDRYGLQRSTVLQAGELTAAAASRIARTYLARNSEPIVSASLTLTANDSLTGYGGQPIPPYMARAGQWFQVGDERQLIAINVSHDLSSGQTQIQLGGQGESFEAFLAAVDRDVELRRLGTNPVGGRAR